MHRLSTITLVATLLAPAAYLFGNAAQARVVYGFTGDDGAHPEGGTFAQDKHGIFYGTTWKGGAANEGTIFKVGPIGGEIVLHSFTGGSDGGMPIGGVIRDRKGNLYGTTAQGGIGNKLCVERSCGTVYKLSKAGDFTALYSFKGKSDGGNPVAGLIMDEQGNLYGTTEQGGDETGNCGKAGCGTVFKIAGKGKETVLYSFRGHKAKDGEGPHGELVMDDNGNLYGTTYLGGEFCNCGTVFKLTADGHETLLHSFKGKDGSGPIQESLIFDRTGNLYGTTENEGGSGCGTAFRLSPEGKLATLYEFYCGPDGGYPLGGLTQDANGNLYGSTSTSYGGSGGGTIYRIAPDRTFSVLHSFYFLKSGWSPSTGLLLTNGHLYGGTFSGGSRYCYCGTVFSVKE